MQILKGSPSFDRETVANRTLTLKIAANCNLNANSCGGLTKVAFARHGEACQTRLESCLSHRNSGEILEERVVRQETHNKTHNSAFPQRTPSGPTPSRAPWQTLKPKTPNNLGPWARKRQIVKHTSAYRPTTYRAPWQALRKGIHYKGKSLGKGNPS